MDVEQDLFKIRLEKKEVITVSNAVVTEKKKEEPEKKTLNSPLVGTFYAAIKPGEDPLVKDGQMVEYDQPLFVLGD